MSREVVVAITDVKLDFGPWEQIFYEECDGRRPKRVLVCITLAAVCEAAKSNPDIIRT
jgi:thiamine phosphate synthase YjbQ (UPF0047 family)